MAADNPSGSTRPVRSSSRATTVASSRGSRSAAASRAASQNSTPRQRPATRHGPDSPTGAADNDAQAILVDPMLEQLLEYVRAEVRAEMQASQQQLELATPQAVASHPSHSHPVSPEEPRAAPLITPQCQAPRPPGPAQPTHYQSSHPLPPALQASQQAHQLTAPPTQSQSVQPLAAPTLPQLPG